MVGFFFKNLLSLHDLFSMLFSGSNFTLSLHQREENDFFLTHNQRNVNKPINNIIDWGAVTVLVVLSLVLLLMPIFTGAN